MINDGGWHSTGVIGVIAATAACAKLLKLPVDKAAESLGIAASLASGCRQLRHHVEAAACRQRGAQCASWR